MITFITPTQGNPIALKRTLDSLEGIVDEIIIGSVCVFKKDEIIINAYQNQYNLRVIKLPFNFIFHSGFSNTLNYLASNAKNDLVLYMNVGEVIEVGKNKILSTISPEYNSYFLNHAVEKHRWFRLYNKNELSWNGIIHEEIIGEHKPYHKPIFQFADTDKDIKDAFRAKVMNDVKELVYFNLYKQLVEHPERRGITHEWWQKFAKENYDTMKERLEKKGKRYEAFMTGDFEMYMQDICTNHEFEEERFDSTALVEFQGSYKSL